MPKKLIFEGHNFFCSPILIFFFFLRNRVREQWICTRLILAVFFVLFCFYSRLFIGDDDDDFACSARLTSWRRWPKTRATHPCRERWRYRLTLWTVLITRPCGTIMCTDRSSLKKTCPLGWKFFPLKPGLSLFSYPMIIFRNNVPTCLLIIITITIKIFFVF